MRNNQCTIIAGPCSVDENNISEIYDIAKIAVTNKYGQNERAIAGTRVVGLKSRTALDPRGAGMGIDYAVFQKNLATLMNGGSARDLDIPPSVIMAQKIVNDTALMVSSEIMAPLVQLPLYERVISPGKFMPWNPSVEQLGWHVYQIAQFARRNNWHIGIKNGKWLGESLGNSNSPESTAETSMEKTWKGLCAYADMNAHCTVLIHRGVDVPEKEDHRNMPVHEIAKRVKWATDAKLFFDPSHAYGPKMREAIVPEVIKAMALMAREDEYLYDGILIEAGTSQTDAKQHITLVELRDMVSAIASFRELTPPQ